MAALVVAESGAVEGFTPTDRDLARPAQEVTPFEEMLRGLGG